MNKNVPISFLIPSTFVGGLANLQLYFNGKLISNEPVYVPSYIHSLSIRASQVSTNHFELHDDLNLLNSDETLFKYLLEVSQFGNRSFSFSLDETIDQYLIFIAQKGETIRLVWKCWDEVNINEDHQLDKVYGTTISKNDFNNVVKDAITKLKSL